MTVDLVPIVDSLSSIYTGQTALKKQSVRWHGLQETFKSKYGHEPTFVARSPGRVNIIGEHIDYSLFDVLPMAITQDVLIAVLVDAKSSNIELQNIDEDRFGKRCFNAEGLGVFPIDSTVHEWSNYFLSGVRGALNVLGKDMKVPGMKILVDGKIPTGSGLSSSSAFVCAAVLAIIASVQFAHDDKVDPVISKSALVQTAVVSERFVGVNSGGMDQTASVFGIPGHALRISFYPKLRADPVEFVSTSPGFSFVVANSLVLADKHVTGPVHYNLRVVETTLAAEIFAVVLNLGKLPIRDGFGASLRVAADAYGGIKNLLSVIDTVFPKSDGYTLSEIADILHTTPEILTMKYMTRFPVRAEKYQLRSRTLHVLQEALRVEEFCTVLDKATSTNGEVAMSTSQSEAYLKKLGSLMNDSFTSCRDLFDCSCPELDKIVSIALASGAYGSRLTGAGWGGSTVSLVRSDLVPEFLYTLKREYYNVRWPELDSAALDEAILVTEPARGSAIVAL
ncbi:ribosomal protein S5 domain 2-type protein [Dipodascopsis uninucleata]